MGEQLKLEEAAKAVDCKSVIEAGKLFTGISFSSAESKLEQFERQHQVGKDAINQRVAQMMEDDGLAYHATERSSAEAMPKTKRDPALMQRLQEYKNKL